jgi:hypothetical protein
MRNDKISKKGVFFLPFAYQVDEYYPTMLILVIVY